nr:MAG: wsv321-like protein [Penaeus monodon endogenous nimavirus]
MIVMGFLTLLFLVIVFSAVVSYIGTKTSNYLDPKVNPTLDVARFLRLDLDTSTDEKRIRTNNILLPKLSLLTKLMIIHHESGEEVTRIRNSILRIYTDEKISKPDAADTTTNIVTSAPLAPREREKKANIIAPL